MSLRRTFQGLTQKFKDFSSTPNKVQGLVKTVQPLHDIDIVLFYAQNFFKYQCHFCAGSMHRYIYFSLPHFQVYDGIKICSYAGIGNSTIRYLTMHNIRKKNFPDILINSSCCMTCGKKNRGQACIGILGFHLKPGLASLV